MVVARARSQSAINPAALAGEYDLPILGRAFEAAFMRFWAIQHVRTETGKPLEFDERPWLKAIWDDPHPRQAGLKSAQMGWTMLAMTKAFHRAGVHGETVIYTMPGKLDAGSLVSGRIDKIIDQSPELRRLAGRGVKFGRRKPSDNTELKHMGQGIIYFRGTRGETGALSVPAHVLIHDEVDASNQESLDTYDSRLDAVDPPSARQKYMFSTPTVPNVGIHALYQKGTMHQWLLRCLSCGWEGPPDYYDHTEGHLLYLKCTVCGSKLNTLEGRYVAEHPDKDLHSYHLTRLLECIPGRPDRLQRIHERRQTAEHDYLFDNMVLGIPSKKGTYEIDPERVKAVGWQSGHSSTLGAELFSHQYFLAADQGNTLTVMVGKLDPASPGQLRVVYRQRLRDPDKGSEAWGELDRLMEAFQIRMAVVDAMPNSTSAHDFAKRHKGKVLCCFYGDDLKVEVHAAVDVRKRAEGEMQPYMLTGHATIDESERVDITVDRTMSLDRTAADLQSGVFQFPDRPEEEESQEMLRHFAHNIRRPERKGGEDGHIVYRWVRQGGANDYFHSANYLRLAVLMGTQLVRPQAVVPSAFSITGVSLPNS